MINIIDPHKNKSREVREKDISRVRTISIDMLELAKNPPSSLKRIVALAHSQVEKKDPLRFFVMDSGEIIINPQIIKHTNTTVDSEEGCLSFPNEPSVIVQRWNKCEVNFQKIESNKLVNYKENTNGQRAKMFQHEIDHFNAKYIYELNS